MDYEKIEKEFYEKSWESMKGKFSDIKSSYRSNKPSKAVQKYVAFLKKHKLNGNILDVGCGNGRNLALFAKNGYNVYGIDISKAAIKIAKNNAKKNNLKISFGVGSVFNLPYKKEFFDALLDSGCLHHLRKSEWKKYLKNINRVLKPGGYLLLYCFSKNSGHIPNFSPKSKNRNWTLRNGHFNHFFTDKEIKDTFSKKFKIINNYEMKKTGTPLIFKVFLMQKK